MLYGTKKPLGIIDLPDSSQFFEHLKKRVVDFSNSVNFEQILDTYLAHLEEDADFEKKREEHMLDSLGPVLEKLVKEHPELSKPLPFTGTELYRRFEIPIPLSAR